ncbi:hypothetical protein [Zunongwangia pacifica]|uniref:Uncharacterized protein n=1 Tax=Zunongwangia pacifica TaxID=2911062 RepID=A0A9X2CNB6_9FLAO|nr:hypothetical protein [Zunongwangia pacifica]MCL6218459.1 hypothetical protein [Zunongwangia pacifica]
MKRTITTLLFYFAFVTIYSQTNSISLNPITIKSIVVDTIKTKLNSNLTRVLWLNDTITVNIQNKNIKIDTTYLEKLRKSLKDSTLYRTQQDIDDLIQITKTGGQNCYTYALEKYFLNNETFDQYLFGKRSSIDRESAEKILNNYFKKIGEISTKPSKNLKQAIPNDVLLAFVNQSDWVIHFVYFQNDIFYSKNGIFKPIEFQSLKKFLKKHYGDTKKIVFYKIDEVKIKDTCAKNGNRCTSYVSQ